MYNDNINYLPDKNKEKITDSIDLDTSGDIKNRNRSVFSFHNTHGLNNHIKTSDDTKSNQSYSYANNNNYKNQIFHIVNYDIEPIKENINENDDKSNNLTEIKKQ